MIRYCLDNSVAVGTKLLDMGINVFLPKTKLDDNLDPFARKQLIDILNRYTNDPNNVEALFLGYDNGFYDIHIDSANTRYSTAPMQITQRGDRYYWKNGIQPNSPINTIGHTHFGTDSLSSPKDDSVQSLPGIRYVIFQGGTFRDF